jgi:hypothetical protein
VYTTADFTTGEKTWNWLAGGGDDAGLWVDMQTTHSIVEYGGHERNVEEVVHSPLAAVEELE